MCLGCVAEEYDAPPEVWPELRAHPGVIAAAEAIRALYTLPDCDTGGPLHVIVEDTNVDDDHLDWRNGWHKWDAENQRWGSEIDVWWDDALAARCDAIVELLRPLTLPQRAMATVMGSADA